MLRDKFANGRARLNGAGGLDVLNDDDKWDQYDFNNLSDDDKEFLEVNYASLLTQNELNNTVSHDIAIANLIAQGRIKYDLDSNTIQFTEDFKNWRNLTSANFGRLSDEDRRILAMNFSHELVSNIK